MKRLGVAQAYSARVPAPAKNAAKKDPVIALRTE